MGFSHFKNNVSIVTLAEKLGYTLNPAAGKKTLEYTLKGRSNVLIKNPGILGKESYYTRDYESGSVIDFVLNRVEMFGTHYGTGFPAVNKILGEICTNPQPLIKTLSTTNSINHKTKVFNPLDYEIEPFSIDKSKYLLLQRKLTEKTLKKFSKFIFHISQQNSEYTNIGFPYTIGADYNRWVGVELVNYSFSHHAKDSDKRNGTWSALFAPSKALVKDVFFGESTIDIISYYQLNQKLFNFDYSVFVSTGGYPTNEQMVQTLRAYPNAVYHSVFDNDLAGHMYDIRLECLIAKKRFTVKKKDTILNIDYEGSKHQLETDKLTLKVFRKLTGIKPQIKAHKPITKDFNEDLVEQTLKLSNET